MVIRNTQEKLREYGYNIEEIILDRESNHIIENILSEETEIKVEKLKECYGIPIDISDEKLCSEEDCLIIFRLRKNSHEIKE